MKTFAERVGIIALLAIIVLGVAGCSFDNDPVYKLTARNTSSVPIDVTMRLYIGYYDGVSLQEEANWTGTIAAGATRTLQGSFDPRNLYAWGSVRYTVDGKSNLKRARYAGTREGTQTITQSDINALR